MNSNQIQTETFKHALGTLYHNKFTEYIDHRRTMTLVDYTDTGKFNQETDCPVCYESMIEEQHNNIMTGNNCEHNICMDCFLRITNQGNNKCPICRKILNGDDEEEEQDETEDETEEEEEEEEEVFTGDNQRPTITFNGRRWFNTETNTIEYFDRFNTHKWTTNKVGIHMEDFMRRSYDINFGDYGNCCCCGIQNTEEVNEYMINSRTDYIDEKFRFEDTGDRWEFFFEGSECFDCYIIHFKTMKFYDNL
jgi:glutaredoxin